MAKMGRTNHEDSPFEGSTPGRSRRDQLSRGGREGAGGVGTDSRLSQVPGLHAGGSGGGSVSSVVAADDEFDGGESAVYPDRRNRTESAGSAPGRRSLHLRTDVLDGEQETQSGAGGVQRLGARAGRAIDVADRAFRRPQPGAGNHVGLSDGPVGQYAAGGGDYRHHRGRPHDPSLDAHRAADVPLLRAGGGSRRTREAGELRGGMANAAVHTAGDVPRLSVVQVLLPADERIVGSTSSYVRQGGLAINRGKTVGPGLESRPASLSGLQFVTLTFHCSLLISPSLH